MIRLSTLYVNDHDIRVGVSKKALVVRRDRKLVARFPIEELEAVVLASRAPMTTEAIGRCVDHGVRVSALRRGGGLRFCVGGPTDGSILLRVAQYRATEDPTQVAGLARQFVLGKIANQRRLMMRWSESAAGLDRNQIQREVAAVDERRSMLDGTNDGDRIRGIEGDVARRYFKVMAGHLRRAAPPPFCFARRSRRPPRDPTNALLSFLYGLLTARAIGALEAVGLDPQLGFLHGARPGRPSLALDLVEEHRPLWDRFAIRLITRGEIRDEDFVVTAGGAHYLTDDGRGKLFRRLDAHQAELVEHPLLRQEVPRSLLVNVQATVLARTIRGDISPYPPLVMG